MNSFLLRDKAIRNLYSDVVIVTDSEAFDESDNPIALDQASVDTETARLQSEYDAQAYARTRADAYPSIGDQLDMLWHAIEANATLKTRYADFHTAIKAVKDANPKP